VADLLGAGRARTLATEQGLSFVDLDSVEVDPDAVGRVPESVLADLQAFPYRLEDGVLYVAIATPTPDAAERLAGWADCRIELAIASLSAIEERLQGLASHMAPVHGELILGGEGQESLAVRTVSEIIRRAAERRASDIHLVPRSDYLDVRIRVDGVVEELDHVPPELAAQVISRLKVISKLDVAEHRKPQDGRLSISTTTGGTLDMRVAVIPTVTGEGMVLRLLGKELAAPTLTSLGLSNGVQMELERIIGRAEGALLSTGPTGSGKSTTLYAALADLAHPEINVITVEDPVEYELPGAYQIQINPTAGLTFPSALRAVLRGDPDVLMVGEIRDLETARLAAGAALTGHFLLSSLHTADAPSALTRLLEMGVEPFVVASGVTAVLGQRLARRLCLYCRQPYEPAANALATLLPEGEGYEITGPFYRPGGCTYCNGGYHGRVGIFQLMRMNEELRDLTAASAGYRQFEDAARRGGMQTLVSDALTKVQDGLISLDELYRVLA
jgi:type II secretory ATPase GspE/PulE/Tfp pilus assembly ATPase PilB-like protein